MINKLVGEGERGALFLVIGGVLEAPGFGVYVGCESGAVLTVVSCKIVPHSLVASGKWFFFQPAIRHKSFINHGICIRPFQSYKIYQRLLCTASARNSLAGEIPGCRVICAVCPLYH